MNNKKEIKGQAIDLAEHVEYSEGAVVSKTLFNKKNGSLTLFAFDEGQNLSEHTSPYDATVYILDGEGKLVIGGEEVKAQQGQMVIMPANIPHDVQAEQRFKMLLVMIK
jgi:quercetin dioxygenase-like cupin family protein